MTSPIHSHLTEKHRADDRISCEVSETPSTTQDHSVQALGTDHESHQYLKHALALAEQGLYTTDPNPRVGCVIVRDGQIVGEGAHWQAGSAHAEVHALAQAQTRAKGADVYVTLEPCSHYGRTPPCADALISAGVARVIVGMQDPNPVVSGQGIARLRAAGITVALLKSAPQLQQAIAAINAGYIHRWQQGRPLVRLKMATSLDGRTAMASGESRWITGEAARKDVHRLRARSSAIVTGINTVLMDNARLTVRPEAHDLDYPEVSDFPFTDFPFAQKVRQPLRVVLDSQFRLPLDHGICSQAGQTLVMGLMQNLADHSENSDAPAVSLLDLTPEMLAGHACMRVSVPAEIPLPNANLADDLVGMDIGTQNNKQQHQRTSLLAVLAGLGRLGINEVLIEAGPTLAGAFIAEKLVDELWLYQAPKLLGHNGRPLVNFNLTALAQAPTWQFKSVAAFGEDMRYILTPAESVLG